MALGGLGVEVGEHRGVGAVFVLKIWSPSLPLKNTCVSVSVGAVKLKLLVFYRVFCKGPSETRAICYL